MERMKRLLGLFSFFAALALPQVARAHEVYVLSNNEIQNAIATDRFSIIKVITQNFDSFAFWALIGIIVVIIVFFISISRHVEDFFSPLLTRLPRYAPLVGRITIALSLFAAVYYGALFGPELPLTDTFGSLAGVVRGILLITATMILLGWYTRVAALAVLTIFIAEVCIHGTYMFTYTNYFGELLLLTILGAHVWAVHHREHERIHMPRIFQEMKTILAPFAFLFLRIAFGFSLIYASVWAKIINNNLALAVASSPLAGHTTSLAAVFGFDPHFLVLGAAIIEVVIGLFFILGIEIRFTSLFLLFWLTLSLWYFGEIVWPHLILIGIPISFIFYGYDRYSLEGYFFKRGGREPVL